MGNADDNLCSCLLRVARDGVACYHVFRCRLSHVSEELGSVLWYEDFSKLDLIRTCPALGLGQSRADRRWKPKIAS